MDNQPLPDETINKAVFAENLFTIQRFVSEVDDIIESIYIHYTDFIVIKFCPEATVEDIHSRLKEYGFSEYEFSSDEKQHQVLILK